MSKIFNPNSIKEICKGPEKVLLQAPWEDVAFYSEWLAQTAFFVSHSTHLLSLCAAHCNSDQQIFHDRFISHAAEEKGHARLAIKDIQNIGLDFTEFSEASATMSLYQPQYFWIQFKSPIAFFGYIFCLEIIAKEAGPTIFQKTIELYGPKASHFIRVHAEEDQDHVEKALKMLNQINEVDGIYAMENLIQSCDNYTRLVDHCQAMAARKCSAA